MLEIEKKFLVVPKNLPNDLFQYEFFDIKQGYLPLNSTSITVRRVRSKVSNLGESKYFYTEKLSQNIDGNRVSEENEKEISESEFIDFWEQCSEGKLEKRRYNIPFQSFTIELDVFGGSNVGLIIAEVEFPSITVANSFVKPNWFGIDVSNEEKYLNKNLAKII
jgi:CYTH domain-containing protein